AGGGAGAKRGAPRALANDGALTQDRPRADLRNLLAVHDCGEHPVQHQVELVAGIALLDAPLVRLQLAAGHLRAPLHDAGRELALQGGLGLRDERLRIFVAPRRVLAVGLAVPVLEVDRSRLLGELALSVVDEVPGKRAGSYELVLRGTIRPDRERQGRPGRGRVDTHERTALDPPGGGKAGAAADGLDESNLVLANLGLRPQGLEGDTLEDDVLRADLERRGADVARALMPVPDDLAVLDLDPGPEV